ncbi:MAG: YkgJ family cysteine cluster protein [Akkermansia sp.]|nr:YkgJ family cysteine cluster protein [Akkermansia sp.]
MSESQEPEKIVHSCQRCGACCRWEGDVCLTDEDISAIAAYLQMEETDFINKWCHLQRNRRGLSLIDAPDGACIMLEKDNTCRIQSVKPRQCRDFPYKWNFPGWEERCPGAGKIAQTPS